MKSKEIASGNRKIIISNIDNDNSVMDFYEDDFCWMRVNISEDCFKLSDGVVKRRKYFILGEKYLLDGIDNMTFDDIHAFFNYTPDVIRRYPNLIATIDFFFKNDIEHMRSGVFSREYIFYHGNFALKLRGVRNLTYKDICNLSHKELLKRTDIWSFADEKDSKFNLVKIHDYDVDFFMYLDVQQRAYRRVYKDNSKFIKTEHIFNFTEKDKKYMLKAKLSGAIPIVVHVRDNGDLMWDSIETE